MSDIVFILGAGASKQAGAPLMNEFIDTAENILRAKQCGPYESSFELVFKGIAALQPVYAKAMIDTNNLEAVFSAFEMAKLFGRLGPLAQDEISELPTAIRRVILRTLEETIGFPVSGGIDPPVPYGEFARLVERIVSGQARPARSVSILTFNYDLAIDFALWQRVRFSYQLGDAAGAVDLLKLHGSLNWQRCEKCGEIAPWRLSDFFQVYKYQFLSDTKTVSLDVGQKLTAFNHCRDKGGRPPTVADPVIIPPTWSKTAHYNAIAGVWRCAAAHLAEAREIYVIGYSLPDTDEFFRYLYALGTVSSNRLRRFWVFDPDPTERLSQRFAGLLGPLAQNRFQLLRTTFSEAQTSLSDAFAAPVTGMGSPVDR